MIVMPADNSKWQVHFWQGKYGGLGHLYSLGSKKGPYDHLPYALDNGRFPCWANGKPWDFLGYIRLLEWVQSSVLAGHRPPLWVLAPDVVGNKEATLQEWHRRSPFLRSFGWPLAFAAQDGMTPDDVPLDADVVFLGGTDEFKRPAIPVWCAEFPRVHVGRINTHKWLMVCYEAGAESCDGTGWFRGNQEQLRGLEAFLYEQLYHLGGSEDHE